MKTCAPSFLATACSATARFRVSILFVSEIAPKLAFAHGAFAGAMPLLIGLEVVLVGVFAHDFLDVPMNSF